MRTIIVAAALMIAIPAHAGVFKCIDASGKTAFQDKPCTSDVQQTAVSIEESAAAQKEREWQQTLLQWTVAERATSKVINNGFDESVWQVKAYLNTALKDPDSVEYFDWSKVLTRDNKEYLVRCRYKAKNSLGGFVVEEKAFYLDKEGNVLDVVLYKPGLSLPAHFRSS